MGKARYFYIDVLRITAIVFILYNHSLLFDSINFMNPGAEELFLTLAALLSKCGPPMFFMISGALLLGRNETFKQVFTHRILRFIVVIIAVSIIMSVYSGAAISDYPYILFVKVNWYFYAYLAFLLMLPVLRVIAQKTPDRDMRIAFIIIMAFYSFGALIPVFDLYSPITQYLGLFTSSWPSNCWCIIFPLMGYYLANNKVRIRPFAIGSAVCAVIAILLTFYVRSHSMPIQTEEEVIQRLVILPACLVFALAKNYASCSSKVGLAVAEEIAGTCFGIFILERSFCLSEFTKHYIADNLPSSALVPASLVQIAAEFILFAMVVYLLRRIPAIRKYL